MLCTETIMLKAREQTVVSDLKMFMARMEGNNARGEGELSGTKRNSVAVAIPARRRTR